MQSTHTHKDIIRAFAKDAYDDPRSKHNAVEVCVCLYLGRDVG